MVLPGERPSEAIFAALRPHFSRRPMMAGGSSSAPAVHDGPESFPAPTRNQEAAFDRGRGAGRRIQAVRLAAGHAAGPLGLGGKRFRGRDGRGAGAGRTRAGLSRRPRGGGAGPRDRASRGRGGGAHHADRGEGVRHSRKRKPRCADGRRLPRHRHLRCLPRRTRGSGQQAIPLSLHQLHRLRPAVHDHHGSSLRPTADDDAGV